MGRTLAAIAAGLVLIAGKPHGAIGPATEQRSAQVPTQTPAQASKPACAVSGEVVDGRTGRPVPGAFVSIVIVGSGSTRSEVTDALGRFVFMGLASNTVGALTAVALGYGAGSYGQSSPDDESAVVSLAPGQWIAHATVPVWRTLAIEGTVTDEAGAPVIDATVQSFRLIFMAGEQRIARGPSAKTDDRGFYRVSGLSPGRYLVAVVSTQMSAPAAIVDAPPFVRPSQPGMSSVVAAPGTRLFLDGNSRPPILDGGRVFVYPRTFYPQARTTADATPIELTDIDRSGVDLRITPVRSVTVTGTVDGPAGAVSDLSVRLIPTGDEALGSSGAVALARVAGDGQFAFAGIPSGRYTLLAAHVTGEFDWSATGIPPMLPVNNVLAVSESAIQSAPRGTMWTTTSAGQTDRSDYGNSYAGQRSVDVGDDDVSGVMVTMVRTARLSGRLVQESGAGVTAPSTSVMSAVGLPVAAESAEGRPDLGAPHSRTDPHDPTAQFEIGGLLPGAYVLKVPSGTGIVRSIVWNGEDHTYAPFDVSSGRDFNDVVITLSTKPASITGTVRDTAGRVVPSAAVIVFPVEAAQWSHYGFDPPRIRSRRVTETGQYTVNGLPAGAYFIAAVPARESDRSQEPAFLASAAASAARAQLDWGATRTIDLVLQSVR